MSISISFSPDAVGRLPNKMGIEPSNQFTAWVDLLQESKSTILESVERVDPENRSRSLKEGQLENFVEN